MSDTNKPEVLQVLKSALDETEKGCDLQYYAAMAALRELHENWRAAVGDNWNLRWFLEDIDEVKKRLDEHREVIIAGLAAIPVLATS